MENKNFRPDIEGLRGIAVLLVVAFHAGVPGFTGGFIGVDVFFVLSGYLITGLLVKEMEKNETISLLNFYARRARRLLPASAIMLLITVIATYLIFPPIQQKGIPGTSVSTAVYVSNFYFLVSATDYFAAAPETNPLLHTWSLSVEEQFYFIWPLLVMLALKFGRKRGLLIVMIGTAILSFVLSVWLTNYRPPWAFFSSPTRAWEFAIGALGIMVTGTYNRRIEHIAGWSGVLMILTGAFLFDNKTQFPGWAALLPVVGTTAVLRCGSESLVSQFLSGKILQFFGRLSYSWYLWHWPVLVLAKVLFPGLSLSARLACILLSLGIAQISYKFVESPIRFHPVLLRRATNAISMAIVITLFGIGVTLTFRHFSKQAEQLPEQKHFTATREDLPPEINKCGPGYFESNVIECTFDKNESNKKAVLLGDSHAAQWFSAVRSYTQKSGLTLVTVLKSSCPPVDVSFIFPNRRFYECEQWRANAFDHIKAMRPELVILSANQRIAINENSKESIAEWMNGLRRMFIALNESNATIIYVRDTPRPGFDVVECVARASWQAWWRNSGSCIFRRKSAINDEITNLEKEIANDMNVTYLDMSDEICEGTMCEPENDGVIKYRDDHHLANKFVINLFPMFNSKINEALKQKNGAYK